MKGEKTEKTLSQIAGQKALYTVFYIYLSIYVLSFFEEYLFLGKLAVIIMQEAMNTPDNIALVTILGVYYYTCEKFMNFKLKL